MKKERYLAEEFKGFSGIIDWNPGTGDGEGRRIEYEPGTGPKKCRMCFVLDLI